MKPIIIILMALLITSGVMAQSQPNILWARGACLGQATSIEVSHSFRRVLATVLEGQWQSWPLDRGRIPVNLPYDWNNGAPYCSALTRGDSVLVCGVIDGRIVAWDLNTNQ